jgi:drug/metabolite transporter (DMT)-like permease
LDNRTVGLALVVPAVIALTIAQLVIKSRLTVHGAVPFSASALPPYLLVVLLDWQLWLAAAGLIFASLAWYAAVSRLPLSTVFPFAALAYPLIFVGSLVFLKEAFDWRTAVANALIVAGILLAATSGQH